MSLMKYNVSVNEGWHRRIKDLVIYCYMTSQWRFQ